MLSTKSVLPNFIKALITASMVLGSAAAFANDAVTHEKIIDLKDMKQTEVENKSADAVEELKSELNASRINNNELNSSLSETDQGSNKYKAIELHEKLEEIEAGE